MQGQETNSTSGSPQNAGGIRLLKTGQRKGRGLFPDFMLGSWSTTKRGRPWVLKAGKQKGRGRFPDFKLGSIRELDVAIIATQ
jgi:hypothetical protein